MESMRKRATAACDYCRKRKRRCDGKSPACTLCEDNGLNCTYNGTDSRSTQAKLESTMLHRFEAMEQILHSHSRMLASLEKDDLGNQLFAATPSAASNVLQSPVQGRPSSISQSQGADFNGHGSQLSSQTASNLIDVDLPPMTIPLGHSTTTERLLVTEQVQRMVGSFPSGIFLEREIMKSLPEELKIEPRSLESVDLPVLRANVVGPLVDAYFLIVHQEVPILIHDDFKAQYHNMHRRQLQMNSECALYLTVLALGSLVTSQTSEVLSPSIGCAPGAEYLSPAVQILINRFMGTFGDDIYLPQALLLAARYYGYLLCPLPSWRLTHMASTTIQQVWNRAWLSDVPNNTKLSLTATSWGIFDIECDLIAEHQLPRSGIEHVVDSMPLPASADRNSRHMLCWLAELSVRRLLNRVHHVMYRDDAPPNLPTTSPSAEASTSQRSISTMVKMSTELNHQLETWFELLPSIIKPNLHSHTSYNVEELNLLLRYHSAKDIIFRPFVMYACNLAPRQELPNLVLDWCEVCIKNCMAYIDLAAYRLEQPSSGREIILHSVFASAIIVTLAEMCTLLRHMVAEIDSVQCKAISTIEKFAFEGSCIEDMLQILIVVRAKTRIMRPSRHV